MDNLRSVMAVSPKQMDEWKEICSAFAKKEGAELLFVNDYSCGLGYHDGRLWHPTIEDMKEYLENLDK